VDCVLIRQVSVLQLVFELSVSLNSIHVDLNIRRHSRIVERSETVVLVTHYSNTVDVDQLSRHIRARAKRANFETVDVFVVYKPLLQEVIVQVTGDIHRNYLYNASGFPPSQQI